MNNRIIKAFLCFLFFSIITTSHAALSVDMGNSAESSGIHTFPHLYISGNSDDKGYLIRFGFSGTTAVGDAITLPALPAGWSETTISTAQERIIMIPSGATADDLQAYLQTVQITISDARVGQELTLWIGEDSGATSRNLYYLPDNGHWYEFIEDHIKWADAYNAALDKRFSGLSGYLITVTSTAENDLAYNIGTLNGSRNFWFAGTTMDIREVMDATGRLTGTPATTLGYWYWTTGPEWTDNNKDPEKCAFYDRASVNDATATISQVYYPNYWLSGEPNNWGGSEAFGYYDLGHGAFWSDVNGDGNQYYIVEYNGTMQSISVEGIIAGSSVKSASISGTANNGTPALPVLLHNGETISYMITAANLSASSDVVIVRDTVPEGLNVTAYTTGASYNSTTREIMWTLSIPAGTESTVGFTAEKITGATNLMTNTAYVISDGTTIKKTNSTYHTGEAKLKRISHQYMACPGSNVEVGFYEQEGVSFNWYDTPSGGTLIHSGNSITEIKDNSAMQTWYVEVTYDGEVLPNRIQVDLELAANCGSATPQGCAIEGTLLFKEDFGGNHVSDPAEGSPLDGNLITYSYDTGSSVADGYYVITKQSRPGGGFWYIVNDHTYPDDATRGYMLQVNASQNPGQFYSFRIDGLLSNTTLYFSTWIMSVLNYNGVNPTNMIFVLEDGNDNVIAKYYTGDVPDSDPTWKQYGFEFTIPDGQTSLILKIINNGNGSSGNDFVMDDIEVRLCVPGAEIHQPVASDTTICANRSINLIGSYTDRDNIYGNDLVYRWEWSTTGDVSEPNDWSVVSGTGISGISGTSGTGTVSSTLTIDEMLPEYDMYYRFIVANAQNINEYYWRAMSRVIQVVIDTCIIANDDAVTTIVNTPIEVNILANDSLNSCGGSVTIALSTQLTAQHGSASIVNNNIIYTPDTDWTGADSLRYVITDCAGNYSDSAVLHIAVVEKPDNIVNATCFVTPPATSWTIKESERLSAVSTYMPALTGDLNGDGLPEIVIGTEMNTGTSPFTPSIHVGRKIKVLTGGDFSNPTVFSTIEPYNPIMPGVIAIAVINMSGIDTGIIVVAEGDLRLRAYNIAGNLLWTSTDYFTDSSNPNYTSVSVGFADFNNDGKAEVYCGNRIFDAETGVFKCKGSENEGYTEHWGSLPLYSTIAADITGNGRLELIAGNQVYEIADDLSSMTVISTVTPPDCLENPGLTVDGEGATSVIDIDNDGELEVLVRKRIGSNVFLYIWSPKKQTVLAQKLITPSTYNNTPFIGDLDGDGNPEIVIISASTNAMYAFKYIAGQDLLSEFWTLPHSDTSGMTGVTLFDFNQDGIFELVYRDETHLRIINGSKKSHITGNDTTAVYNLASFTSYSGTGYEFPVVVDIDNDGAAEILIAGASSGGGVNGNLVIYKSGATPWAPARKVWNQYLYNSINVNEDLTIPIYQFSPATTFPGDDRVLGTSDDVRPYNAFMQQQTMLNKYGTPLWLTPDAYPDPTISSSIVSGDSAYVTIGIINNGDAAIGSPIYVAIYEETVLPANLFATDSADIQINPADTGYITIAIATDDLEVNLPRNLAIRINDNGTVFTYQPECDSSNNVLTILNPALYQFIKKEASLEGVSGNGTYPNPVSVLFSEKIEYTITAINISDISEKVIIRDTLPPYLKYVAGSATTGSGITVDSALNVTINSISYDILKWEFAAVSSLNTEVVSFKASPIEGVCASQPMFINRAWITVGNTIHLPTNYTYHQGASVGIATFSAGFGGSIYHATPQALDYRTSPRSGIIIVPDEGYRFAGWSHEDYVSLRGEVVASQYGIMHYDTLTVYGNIELHANFEPEPYPIRYFLNGGSSPLNPETYTIESDLITLKAPEKPNDLFLGWTGSNGNIPQEALTIGGGSTGELEYYANYLYSGREDRTQLTGLEEDRIWAAGNELYVLTSRVGSILRIYTTEGVLQHQQPILHSGETKIKLARGFYVITLDYGTGKIVRVE